MTTTTTTTQECGLLTAAAKVTRILDLLRSLPMDLPEPTVSTNGANEVRWADVDEQTARRIIRFLGCNDWHLTLVEDPPLTIASRYLSGTFDDHDIAAVVVVRDAMLPDLDAEETSC